MIPGRLHVDDASEAACALGAAGCSAVGLSSAWPGSSGALGNVTARLRRLSDQTEMPSVLEISDSDRSRQGRNRPQRCPSVGYSSYFNRHWNIFPPRVKAPAVWRRNISWR